jgi:ABC-type antimicrobial peptide transport system permease subunit
MEPGLKQILKKHLGSEETIEVFMQPMKDWHLYADFKNGIAVGGFIAYVRIFSIIGLLVLIIACINFVNLSTARSEKRAKEVGIRKAIGSNRYSLIFQFLVESLVITFAAFIVSLVLVQLSLPFFNTLTKTSINIPFSNAGFWLIMMGYVLVTGLLAGSRPAFYFSSFNPVKVLKGVKEPGKSATLPKKILVTLQFSCSIALIISTIIIYQQIQHAKGRPIGYDVNRLMITDGNSDLDRNYVALKNDLLRTGVVSSVTKASVATDLNVTMGVDNWPGQLPGEKLITNVVVVNDSDYFKTLHMQFVQGKNFVGNRSVSVDGNTVILNEAAAKRMRLTNPLGQDITFWGDVQKVIGVVSDAVMTSPFAPSQPTLFYFYPQFAYAASTIMYRIAPGVNTQDAIAKLSPIFNKYNPASPYVYRFADDDYAAKFSLETLISKLAGLFAALAIFISCLGLFGLAAYTAEQRTKEIGIRKVLGASVSQVWLLLSKDFIVLVLISCVIASPVAFYYMHDWLQQYNYRITISPFVFVIAGIAAIVITIITVSFQAIKAAIANPVKSLRTE